MSESLKSALVGLSVLIFACGVSLIIGVAASQFIGCLLVSFGAGWWIGLSKCPK